MTRDTYYVTTPIYYVNDRPHIGHAYTTILADVLARYHRLLGLPTHFLTGTDEHGQKVQKAAEAAGITPQEQADRTVVRFQELWKRLEITNDDFIRTTEPRHTAVVQDILQDLYDRDEIYRDEYDGWYCVPCERFFMAKDLVEEKCPECRRPVERIKEANYFFRMSKYQDWLVGYIKEHPGFIQPAFRANETLGFLRKPLNDLCISRPRSRMGWGIELPFDKDYVCYVWFDALVNYISAVGYLRDDAAFKRWWPVSCHLIGKDILTTHTVYWPTMLKAMGVPQPGSIFAHGWWLTGESKMSKSLGNVVNPMEMVDRYGVDAFRYFLIAEMTLGQDASFTEDAFVRRYNADLANDLGNLLSRIVNMLTRYCGGRVPAVPAAEREGAPEKTLRDTVLSAVAGLERAVEEMKLSDGVGQVVTAVRAVNRYLEEKQPWTLAKGKDRGALDTTLYTAAEALRICAGLLYPVAPGKMAELRRALGVSGAEPDLSRLKAWGDLPPGSEVKEIGSLFPRVVVGEAADEEKPLKQKTQKVAKPKEPADVKPNERGPGPGPREQEAGAGLIEYEDFARVQLRTARVAAAEKIPGATKLLRLEVMLGSEKRQLVAGIALHYEPEELVGKTVVVVANLKPATIRGVASQGMLLAASKGEGLRLVTLDGDMSSGAVVK